MFTVTKVTVNYQSDAVGIIKPPQFGWVLDSDKRNVLQESYRLQLSGNQSFTEILYDSLEVVNGESQHICIQGMALKTASKYYVRVKVRNNYNEETDWSQPASFITGIIAGIMEPAGWMGEFLSGETAESGRESKGSCFRKEVLIEKPVKEAYAFTTALGTYHFFINGRKVGKDEMAPGWTAYQKRLLYQTNDVTEYLKQGKNAIGVMVGAGWYKGTVSFRGVRNHYGKQTAFSAQICIRYEDGTEDWIASDLSWKCQASSVMDSEIYNGEIYDARCEMPGWDLPEFDDADWHPVEKVPYNQENLEPQDSGTVQEKEELAVKRVITTPKGEIVLDFGQNMTGWVRFKVKAGSGEKVHLRFFEVLDAEGNVYTENLRMAKQEIVYICRGGEEECYRPYFTFQGFQYVQVLEYPGELLPENFTACAAYSSMEETGMFRCSNPLVNQLQHNILWGMKGNFFDIPTDCPQRDERLGWTGDAQVFAGTAMWLMNTYGFFGKWLRDLAAEQREDGAVPFTVPHVLEHVQSWEEQGNPRYAAAAWADAAVIIPWNLYLAYGDVQVIRDQYESMKGWIEFMRAHAEEGIWSYHTQFGDHLSLDPEDENGKKATPPELVCCAFYAYSSELFAKMAKACGREQDYTEYFQLSKEIREAFGKHFFDEDGRMKVQTQTAHVLALYFHLVPEKYKKKTIDSLVKLIEAAGGHLRTGFVGTPYLCHVLSRNGHVDTAYELLLKEDFPSWLYQVKQGATTIWEHWDGIKPDGSMWSASMNSFNHYAYGAIGEWLYREVAGINMDEEEPGYKRIIIRPVIGGELAYAEGSYDSVYGEIKSKWSRNGQSICLDIEIPVNTTAEVILEQAVDLLKGEGLVFDKTERGYRCAVGSGTYRIIYVMRGVQNGNPYM